MPVILPDHKLSYFFVPKVACTSLKYMFYEVENGRRFEPFRINGNPRRAGWDRAHGSSSACR